MRFDNSGKLSQRYFNKILEKHTYESYVHDQNFLGGVRSAKSWEMP